MGVGRKAEDGEIDVELSWATEDVRLRGGVERVGLLYVPEVVKDGTSLIGRNLEAGRGN